VAQISYFDVFSINPVREEAAEIRVGDIVRTGPNLYPHYQVIALDADKAWVRNVQTGVDGIAALERLSKVAKAA
jgi:hypothetical protein